MSVRTPPRPPYERQKGRCSLCGTQPKGRRRSWCTDDCVQTWWLATDAAAQLHHLVELHGRACWNCGATTWTPSPAWIRQHRPWMRDHPAEPEPIALEVEHRRPLWSLNPTERHQLRWWLPFNLQLLCVPCHRAKTRLEAADRAAGRQPSGRIEPDPQLPLELELPAHKAMETT